MDEFIKTLFWFLLLICAVKSDDEIQCNDTYVDMENKPINNITEYCANNTCITKCCCGGEILNINGSCANITTLNLNYANISYSAVNVYSWNELKNAVTKLEKNIVETFLFVQNKQLASLSCSFGYNPEMYIIEDASLRHSPETYVLQTQLDYCVEYQVINDQDTTFIFRVRNIRSEYEKIRTHPLLTAGFPISCFFFLLVLIVYCLLPQRRTFFGLLLMAYTSTVFVLYLLRSIIELDKLESFTNSTCKVFAPFLYYFTISSFFWLNAMSFDMFSTLRSLRFIPETNLRILLPKFMKYSLYGWGIPLLLTTLLVIIDNIDLPGFEDPDFSNCFSSEKANDYYMNIPIGIILSVNIFFYIRTANHIWRTKGAVRNCNDSQSTKKANDRFSICVKLAVLMGLMWILELLPDDKIMWLVIPLNVINIYMGILIFLLCVVKTSILIELCNKFKIELEFVKKLEKRKKTGTKTTETTNIPAAYRSPA